MRQSGDWEQWLNFFLHGVFQTAEGASALLQVCRSTALSFPAKSSGMRLLAELGIGYLSILYEGIEEPR